MTLFLSIQDLERVDHTRIYYRPYKKNFYIETPEIVKMTDKGKCGLCILMCDCVSFIDEYPYNGLKL